jgi:hypothetical protein
MQEFTSKHCLAVVLSMQFCQPKHCQFSWQAAEEKGIKRERAINKKAGTR